MASIFTKIINGEIPCYKVAEDDRHIAFLDINPVQEGHTLVVPKKEVDYIFNLDDNDLNDLMTFAKKVAKAIEKVVPCMRIGVAVVGIEVPHTHVHLIPLKKVTDMQFEKKMTLPQEKMEELCSKIQKEVIL